METFTLAHANQEIGVYEQDTFSGVVLGLLPEGAPSSVQRTDVAAIASKKAIYEKDGWHVTVSTKIVTPLEREEDAKIVYRLQMMHPPEISAELLTKREQETYASTSGQTAFKTTTLLFDPDGAPIFHPSLRGGKNEAVEEALRQGKPKQAARLSRWHKDRTFSQSRLHELTMRLGALNLAPEDMVQLPEQREPSEPKTPPKRRLRIVKKGA